MAAGATVGSNHNSRSADGEIIAGRGFWPGLCVSLKHNSRFASYTILAKGDYPVEMNIKIPFSLVSNEVSSDRLVIMPGYWFLYNMYGLARNAHKYVDRDKRAEKKQHIEYDFLAPDSVNEMITGLEIMEYATGQAIWEAEGKKGKIDTATLIQIGRKALQQNDEGIDALTILVNDFENSKRPVVLIKVRQSWHKFREMIQYYAASQIIEQSHQYKSLTKLNEALPAKPRCTQWVNVGGQLIEKSVYDKIIVQISSGTIKGWQQIHQFYATQSASYQSDKFKHAIAAYQEVFKIRLKNNTAGIKALIKESIRIKEEMTQNIFLSRKKDHVNPFRKMVYGSDKEMDAVVGALKDNAFIQQEKKRWIEYKNAAEKILRSR